MLNPHQNSFILSSTWTMNRPNQYKFGYLLLHARWLLLVILFRRVNASNEASACSFAAVYEYCWPVDVKVFPLSCIANWVHYWLVEHRAHRVLPGVALINFIAFDQDHLAWVFYLDHIDYFSELRIPWVKNESFPGTFFGPRLCIGDSGSLSFTKDVSEILAYIVWKLLIVLPINHGRFIADSGNCQIDLTA